MELSDCFGDDPSDLDNLGGAQLVIEDCYIAVYKLDGEEWERRLRGKVMGRWQANVSHLEAPSEYATPHGSVADFESVYGKR